ncbi:YpoC family protein [Planococcus halotolerans]|uniref:YpoC-like domain-containing protein n=1 Tax=Planococcus halotolerans TaxID=2233542 RepID=A0A365L152_9BACL|nr:hypothetical protein [Planococcus halotolerans]RAZ79077.1 hypothetical protein DP120_05530 [Planococcus halotolerans]
MKTLQRSIEKERISPFFEAWAKLDEDIRVLHVNKNSSPAALMNEGIIVYKSLLEQCSSDEEKIEPLNNNERLVFVESNCSTFAAYRQLQELFNEMYKKVASKRAILNRLK